MITEKVKRRINILSILIFVLIISLPIIFLNKNPEKISVVENKKLTSFPKLYINDGKLNYSFISEFEDFIDDNIGFKEKSIQLTAKYQYYLFNRIVKPDIIQGKEGHMFYVSDYMITDFQGRASLSQEDLEYAVDCFSGAQTYFDNKNIDFLIMFIPNKQTVYPEYYPSNVIRSCDKTRVDLLVEYVQAHSNVDIFNIKDSLLAKKNETLLYYKQFDPSHWNSEGAFIGYSELMKRLKEKIPNINVLTEEDFTIETVVRTTKLSNSILISENENVLVPRKAFTYDISEEIPEGSGLTKNSYFQKFTNTINKNMPKLLIVGDSFFQYYLLPYLTESFSEVWFYRPDTSEEIIKMTEIAQPDIVLYQGVERQYWSNRVPDFFALLGKGNQSDFEYNNINQIDNQTELYIDIPALVDNKIPIDTSVPIQSITGWATDNIAKSEHGEVYAKVGDNYYKAEKMSRPDVAKGNPQYEMVGYIVYIPTEELLRVDSISMIVISKDKSYKYLPIKYEIMK